MSIIYEVNQLALDDELWDEIRFILKTGDRVKILEEWNTVVSTERINNMNFDGALYQIKINTGIKDCNYYIGRITDFDIPGERGHLIKSLITLNKLSK